MLLPALFSHPSLSNSLQARSARRMLDKEPLAMASAELKTSAKLRRCDLLTPGSHPCANHSSRCLSTRTRQRCCSGVRGTESVETEDGEASTEQAGVGPGLCADDLFPYRAERARYVTSVPKYTRKLDFTTSKRVDRGRILRVAKQ